MNHRLLTTESKSTKLSIIRFCRHESVGVKELDVMTYL